MNTLASRLRVRRRPLLVTAVAALVCSTVGLNGPVSADTTDADAALEAAIATAAEQPPRSAEAAATADDQPDPPPAPEAATSQTLPLELDGTAEVDLGADASAAADVAPAPVVRHLADSVPDVPSSATTFSTTQAGDASTLVLFDTTGDYAALGEYYALALGTLAGHSGTVTTLPVTDYVTGLAGRYTAVLYTGSTYDESLPRSFVDDVLTGDVPVVWSGFNIWQLASTDADRAAFLARFGWDAATSYIDATDTVTSVTYNGQSLTRDPLNTGGILAPHVTDPQAVTVLAQAQCSVGGAPADCAGIAQTTGSSFPWAVRSSTLTYMGEVGLSYVSEQDRYLALADILLDVIDPDAAPVTQAALRIEDVSPVTDGATLRTYVDYLVGEGVPFQIAVVPVYTDPHGDYNDGVAESYTLADNPDLVSVLGYAVAHGGTLVQHGTTHQYATLDNPYNGVSTDDFEFIRSWCTDVNDVTAPAVACTDQTWVQLEGSVPDDSAGWAAHRVRAGRDLFAQAGLPTPVLFETPHYSASRASYEGIGTVYPTRYERELLYGGTLTGTASTSTASTGTGYIGMFFPYAVNDPYGAHVLPENLGNYAPDEYNQHAIRTAEDIVDNARANLVVTQSTASFFFHPYYPVDVLREIVEGIRALGYTFVPAADLR